MTFDQGELCMLTDYQRKLTLKFFDWVPHKSLPRGMEAKKEVGLNTRLISDCHSEDRHASCAKVSIPMLHRVNTELRDITCRLPRYSIRVLHTPKSSLAAMEEWRLLSDAGLCESRFGPRLLLHQCFLMLLCRRRAGRGMELTSRRHPNQRPEKYVIPHKSYAVMS